MDSWIIMSDSQARSIPYLKNVSKSRWNVELRMSEVIEKNGGMWTTMGIIRGNKLYCSIEETLFLAERGALLVLDANDAILTLKHMYEMVSDGGNGCSWDSFKAFRHLKSLGYIVGRHETPWILKHNKRDIHENSGISDIKLEENFSITKLKPVFDIYLPNSNFRKSSPGAPGFVLCLARYPPSKAEMDDLDRRCNGATLKICNVEHGHVSFFSFNGIELPVLP
ncbi:hypothetical protein ACHQM5_026819 [Ranunculus cassubicifolius]